MDRAQDVGIVCDGSRVYVGLRFCCACRHDGGLEAARSGDLSLELQSHVQDNESRVFLANLSGIIRLCVRAMSTSRFSPSKFQYPRTMSVDTSAAQSPTIGVVQDKINVGILGATGTVGQRFITLLSSHPWFKIHALGASSRSAGKPYHSAASWKQTTPIPSSVRELIVHPCDPTEPHFRECTIIFSGLDAEVAGDIGTFSFHLFNFPQRIH